MAVEHFKKLMTSNYIDIVYNNFSGLKTNRQKIVLAASERNGVSLFWTMWNTDCLFGSNILNGNFSI